MTKISRPKTRRFLFQALYSRIHLGSSFNKDTFIDTYFDEEYASVIDMKYFEEVFAGIIVHETELVYIIEKFAPKFDVSIMPAGNLLPIFVAAYEMLFLKCDTIPVNVSIDEALELSKMYSDDKGRILVNGVLNSFKDHFDIVKTELKGMKEKKAYFFGN
jgi:N utilization substance protein B